MPLPSLLLLLPPSQMLAWRRRVRRPAWYARLQGTSALPGSSASLCFYLFHTHSHHPHLHTYTHPHSLFLSVSPSPSHFLSPFTPTFSLFRTMAPIPSLRSILDMIWLCALWCRLPAVWWPAGWRQGCVGSGSNVPGCVCGCQG